MDVSRRSLLKRLAATATGTAAAAFNPSNATAENLSAHPGSVGMLYDATKCTGCKACMSACNEANGITPDTAASDGRANMPPDLNEHAINIIKLYNTSKNGTHSYVKRQCMHCVDPACVSACMIGALKKQQNGPVTYDPNLCVGCRYCEMACPFNVPKFEWSKAAPKIVKCQLCSHRLAADKQPACTEVCPAGAVIYGKRTDLLDEAHHRLQENPDRYLPRVYGEHEAGGTQVLYLSGVEFEKLGLPAYGDQPVPQTQHAVQHALYQGFVAPIVLYGVLAAVTLRNLTREEKKAEDEQQ